MAIPQIKTVRALISGRVQGVCYRAWTVHTALSLGLTGWVRNRSDGTVEALFQGATSDVDAILSACLSGPRDAEVVSVDVEPHEKVDESGFTQRPTLVM